MEIYTHTHRVPEVENGSVVAIGKFDGVHLGHQEIINTARRIAERDGLPLVVVTFDPHPMKVLAPNVPLKEITPLPHKMNLIEELGADVVYVINFTKDYTKTTAQEFIDVTLRKTLKAKHVVVGGNFNFGYKAQGNVEMLRAQGDFNVDSVGAVLVHGEIVSSSRVRAAQERQDDALVAELLGRSS